MSEAKKNTVKAGGKQSLCYHPDFLLGAVFDSEKVLLKRQLTFN
jgi:hypothetical protein